MINWHADGAWQPFRVTTCHPDDANGTSLKTIKVKSLTQKWPTPGTVLQEVIVVWHGVTWVSRAGFKQSALFRGGKKTATLQHGLSLYWGLSSINCTWRTFTRLKSCWSDVEIYQLEYSTFANDNTRFLKSKSGYFFDNTNNVKYQYDLITEFK